MKDGLGTGQGGWLGGGLGYGLGHNCSNKHLICILFLNKN